MAQNKEGLNIRVTEDEGKKVLFLDPRSMSHSAIKEMVTYKVSSTDETTIFMYYPNFTVYVDPAKLHEIHRLPQQEKKKAIQRITNNIAYSNTALVSTDIIKSDK